jgi:hypothetical protein
VGALFVAIPSYCTCQAAGISTIYGNYSGGQILAMLSSAKALGALTAGVPLLMLAANDLYNPNHHTLGLPADHITNIFLIIAGGLCFVSLALTLLMNPYPLVKEPDDPNSHKVEWNWTGSGSKVKGDTSWKRGSIKF